MAEDVNCEIIDKPKVIEDRRSLLLSGVSQMASPEERRDFLNAVCAKDSALPDSMLETVTLSKAASRPADEQWPSLSAGQIVADRFEIRGSLGAGGMGLVYQAFDRKLGEQRALKFAQPGHFDTLPNEARAALRITHENISRVYEIHSALTGGGPADFISMELVDGETLSARMGREPFTSAEILELARQLCRGMDAAHQLGILHLDLKPANIMLARRPDGGIRLVIMDFGLALLPADAARESTRFWGTPNYIAPERWLGSEPAPSADVYAMGVILYQLLTGRLPFLNGTPWAQRISRLPEQPSRSELAPDPRWDAIVLRCLEPDPARRIASAGALLSAIDQSFGAKTRRWWIAAAVGAAGAAPLIAFRERIWPAPTGRLAALPPQGTSGNTAADQTVRGSLYDLTKRLAPAHPLVLIPFEDTVRTGANSAELAASRLGATHVLMTTLAHREAGFTLSADVRDTRTGISLKRFEGQFLFDHLADLATPLAGVVTSAFHLAKPPQLKVNPAAYPSYAAGMASLNAVPPDLDSALELFTRSLQIDPNAAPALTGLSLAYIERHRVNQDADSLDRAKTAIQRAQSLEPDSVPVLIAMSNVESNEGRADHGLELLRRAAELEPLNWNVWRRIGSTLQDLGRTGEALDALRHAVQLAPDYYLTHRDLGLAYFRQGEAEDAVREFTTVTRLAPGLSEGYLYLGSALILEERDADAQRALSESIRLQPSRFAFNNLAVVLRVQGRNREAVPVLQKALAAGPEDATIRLNLGNALADSGDEPAAREQWQKAREITLAILRRNPRDAAARARAGYSMVRLGDSQLGADEALQAARFAPSDYSVVYWATMALETAHRRDEIFPLLAEAPLDRLRNLRRQPELADLSRDQRFITLLQNAQTQHQVRK